MSILKIVDLLKGGPGSGRHAGGDRKGGSGYSELSGHQNNDAAHKILLQHGFRHVATHEALPNGNTTDVYSKPDHKVSVTSNGYISHEDYKNTAIHEFKGKTGPAQLDKHLSSFKKGGPGSGRHKGVAPGVHEALSAKGYKHEWASSDNKEHRYQHSNGNTVTHQFHGGSASYTNIYGSRMNLLAQPRNNDQLKSKLNEIHGFKKGGPGSGRHNEGKWVQATTKPYVHPKQHKALTDRGYKFVRTVPAQKDPNGTGYHTYKAGTDASEGKFIHVLNTGGVVPSKNEFLKGGPGSGRHASEDRKGGSGYSELSGHQNNDAAHKILLQHGFRHVATHEALPNGNTTDVYHKPDHKVSVTSNGYISHEDYKNTAIHEFKGKTGPAQLDKHLSSFKKGGAGSGNHGHSGRPGSVGGSGGGGVKSSPGNKKDRRNNLKRGVGKANAKLGKANDALKNGETDKANGHLKEVSGHVQDSLHGIAVSGKAKSQYQIQEAMKRNKEIASGLRNPHEKYHSELAHGNHLKEAAANLGELVKLIAEHTKHTLVH